VETSNPVPSPLTALVHSDNPRGNVSHTARGGVANPEDDSARRARSVGTKSAH